MQTILGKEYVQEDEQRRLYPTELGMLVTDLLVVSFPDILNVEFTAGMEETLDGIEDGSQKRVVALRRFYEPFSKDLEKAETEMRNVKAEERPTDIKCDQCGDQMVIRWGRKGEFLACRRYPECKNTKNFTRDDATARSRSQGRDHRRGVRKVRQADARALRPLRPSSSAAPATPSARRSCRW